MSFDTSSSIFAKTPLGQQEIRSRAIGLPPLARRLLVLIDGQRSSEELALYVPGQDLAPLLQHLIDHGCIDTLQSAADDDLQWSTSAAALAQTAATHRDLINLPNAGQRAAKDIEMARNFMTNTINSIIGQNVRFSLIKSIHACATATDLRCVYPAWLEAISDNHTGLKRLPELQEKLFKVL